MIAASAVLASASHAAVVLIDFGTAQAGTGPGGTWNTYGAVTEINGSTVVDSTGAATSITFNKSGTVTASANAGTSLTYNNTSAVGNPSWVATTDNNSAAGDLFYTDNGTGGPGGIGQAVLTFGGLTAGHVFSLDILGSRNIAAASGYYEFSLDGGTTYLGLNVLNPDGSAATAGGWSGQTTKTQAFSNLTDGYTAHRYMNISSVTLTGSTLLVRATDVSATAGNFAALNAIRLIVVPEPASALGLLWGAGLITLGYRRRGQRI